MAVVVVRTTAAAAGTRTVTSIAATSTVEAAETIITRPRPHRPVTGEMTRIFGSAVATTAVLLIGDTMPHGQEEGEQGPPVDRIIIRGTMEVQR